MKVIEAYETEDGKVFNTRAEAERHEAMNELHEWAKDVGLCSGGEWDRVMVLEALLESADRLSKIFNKLREIPAIAQSI